MEAVTKILEPGDPFEDLVSDHKATLSFKALSFLYGPNSIVETMLEASLSNLLTRALVLL